MTAIPVHHTPVDTESDWDGPGEVAKAENDETVLRYMHAWKDADGEPDAKGTYKFPHHEAGADTPANINGVNNALARLPQADIPESDRAGVERHLQAHKDDVEETEDKRTSKAGTAAVRRGKKKQETRKPIRCFDGNAQPYEPFWRFVNEAESESGQAELELYGVLSEFSWFDDDITPKKFKDDLYKYGKGGPVLLKINSPGGDVIAASVMRTIMTESPGEITARVDGLAASLEAGMRAAVDGTVKTASGE